MFAIYGPILSGPLTYRTLRAAQTALQEMSTFENLKIYRIRHFEAKTCEIVDSAPAGIGGIFKDLEGTMFVLTAI